MIITPARVKDLDGVGREFYASATEELIEEALRKLASDQHAAVSRPLRIYSDDSA